MGEIVSRLSPNHDERADGASVDILLLHYTGMPTGEAALERLCDPEAKVSAHYLIDEAGDVSRLVPEERRAWHAGVAHWAGESDINGRSIGIELVNPGHEFGYRAFPEAQMRALAALANDILLRHPIPPERVLAHSDVAPIRKQDPGEKFDWAWLADRGVGHWVEPLHVMEGPVRRDGDRGDDVAELQFMLADYGYGLVVDGNYGPVTHAAVAAFQRHFRPAKIDGIADLSTVFTLHELRDALTGSA